MSIKKCISIVYMSLAKLQGNVKVQDGGKLIVTVYVSPKQTIYIQNVAGTNGLVGFFFNAFRDEVFKDVQVGWFANGNQVANAVVTNVDPANETITISSGNGEFLSGQSYKFSNTLL